MDPIIGDFEVVHVTKPCALLDADFRERVYRRRDGAPLLGGYYVVGWPAGTRVRLFNESAVFRGPFGTRGDAIGAMREMQRHGRPAPGRIGSEDGAQTAAERRSAPPRGVDRG